ncbi:TPA: lysis protein [Vibrio cholerae]
MPLVSKILGSLLAISLVAIMAMHISAQNSEIKQLTQALEAKTAQEKDQKERIARLSEIGRKHLEKLNDAKSENDALRDDLRTQRKRVFVKASCPVQSANPAGSVGDGEAPQLNEAAREDYLRLREMIAETELQVSYLQEYIKTQCLQER